MEITQYRIPAPHRLTVALVSDLHERDPRPVLAALRSVKPDLIAAAGDFLERNHEGLDPRGQQEYSSLHRFLRNTIVEIDSWFSSEDDWADHSENAYAFFREAAKIAPTFYSRGNHEWYLLPHDREVLDACGVTVLENSHCLWNGIFIGGLNPATDTGWLAEFASLPGWKLLLCHHPEYYKKYVRSLPIDAMLSGHAHGGQIRIGRQGIFSTGQGFFPRYTRGLYDGRLIVGTGCANTASFPRFGNPTELVVVHFGA